MTNAELIDLFRNVERSNYPVCNGCPMKYTCGKKKITRCLFGAAADALEAAEKRIARLEEDIKTREAEHEVMQDTIKVCEKRIAELEKYCRECEEIACHYM